jgi:hypothetical protein
MKYPIGTVFCYHEINCPPNYWKFCIIIGHKDGTYSTKMIRYDGKAYADYGFCCNIDLWETNNKGTIFKIT